MKSKITFAVSNAVQAYASSLGISISEAITLFKKHQSTRDCIALLVLAQANPEKLVEIAKTLTPQPDKESKSFHGFNKSFLDVVDSKTRDEILANIAKNYGISEAEALNEVRLEPAEHLLEYLTGPTRTAASLLMKRHLFSSAQV